MTSFIFFFIFIPLLSVILLSVNFILAPHKPYKEKKTPFECGYHSFLAQNRTPFNISFLVFGLLFLVFDLEIVLIYPFTVSSITNSTFGLVIMIIFATIVTIGFIYEIGKGALKIYSKQDDFFINTGTIKDKYLLVNKQLESGFINYLSLALKFITRWVFIISFAAILRYLYYIKTSHLPLYYYYPGLLIISLLSYVMSSFIFRRKPKLTGFVSITIVHIIMYIFRSNPELLQLIMESYQYISWENITWENIKNINIIHAIIFLFFYIPICIIRGLTYMNITPDNIDIIKKEFPSFFMMENNNDGGEGSSRNNTSGKRGFDPKNLQTLPGNTGECYPDFMIRRGRLQLSNARTLVKDNGLPITAATFDHFGASRDYYRNNVTDPGELANVLEVIYRFDSESSTTVRDYMFTLDQHRVIRDHAISHNFISRNARVENSKDLRNSLRLSNRSNYVAFVTNNENNNN